MLLLYQKNLIGPLLQVILENNIDIAALVETETLDISTLINALKFQSQDWKVLEILPETDIKVLAKTNVPISVHREDKHFVSYKITNENQFVKAKSQSIKYQVATIFNVVVQALDNYEKTLLIMYSNPETEYPVAITLESSYEEDCERFTPQYTCNDKESFESTIKEILSSEHVLKTIQMLYSKAAMLAS